MASISNIEKLITALSSYERGALADLRALSHVVTIREIPKGATFVGAGERTELVGFVLEGLFKVTLADSDGRTCILAFPSDSGIICDYVALTTGRSATLTISALESSTVAVVRYTDIRRTVGGRAAWESLQRKLLEHELERLLKRLAEALLLDATERLHAFREEHRDRVGRLSQSDIASYLGVTPVSLSRIRSQLAKQHFTKQPPRRGNPP